MPSFSSDPVTCDDLDLGVTHLQALIQSAIDSHTYDVPVSNQRSSLPAEVIHTIWPRRKLRRKWQRSRDPAVRRRFQTQSLHVS